MAEDPPGGKSRRRYLGVLPRRLQRPRRTRPAGQTELAGGTDGGAGQAGRSPLRVARNRHREPARRLRPCADRRRAPASGSAIPHAPATGPRIARSPRRTPAETPGRCVPVARRNQAAGGRFRRTGGTGPSHPPGDRTRNDTPDEGEPLRQVARRTAPRAGPKGGAGPDSRHGTRRGPGSQAGRSRLRFHPAAQDSGAGQGLKPTPRLISCHNFGVDVVLTVVQPEEIALNPTEAGAVGDSRIAASVEALFREHYGRIAGMLTRLTGDRAHAEEIASDVFHKLSQRPALLDSREDLTAWIYRVATNAGCDAL